MTKMTRGLIEPLSTDEYWNERVVEVRERNSWESPKTELTTKVRKIFHIIVGIDNQN